MVYGKGGDGVVGPGGSMQDEPVGPGENKTSSSGDLSKRQGLITVNDLVYVLEPDLSVATNKTHKVQYFQNNRYEHGSNAICILNSGADYIDTRRSWLQFDVAASGCNANTTRLYLGANGSACNFINQLTISTRSGDILCQLFDFNLMQNIILPLTYDKQWFDTVGQTMGYGCGLDVGTSALAGDIGGMPTNRFCIPLYVLAPLFGYGRLMPAMLMSGLRIEIQWANYTTAFKSLPTGAYGAPGAANDFDGAIVDTAWAAVAPGPVLGYTILDPQLVLSSVQLSDSIQRSLNELSATNGLEIVYPDYERTTTTLGSNTDVHVEIRKSCSRALKAFGRIRFNNFTAAGIGVELINDSFRSEKGFVFTEYQWQLGSLYFPQQPVRSKITTAEGAVEIASTSYNMLLESFDAYHGGNRVALPFHRIRETSAPFYGGQRVGSVEALPVPANVRGTAYNIGEFKPETQTSKGEEGSFKLDAHSVGVTLERSTMFNLAGVPVNNSRVLAFHGRIKGANAAGVGTDEILLAGGPILAVNISRKFDIFLKYVKLCRVFLNNVEVEQ